MCRPYSFWILATTWQTEREREADNNDNNPRFANVDLMTLNQLGSQCMAWHTCRFIAMHATRVGLFPWIYHDLPWSIALFGIEPGDPCPNWCYATLPCWKYHQRSGRWSWDGHAFWKSFHGTGRWSDQWVFLTSLTVSSFSTELVRYLVSPLWGLHKLQCQVVKAQALSRKS